jgi:hypothetical protein
MGFGIDGAMNAPEPSLILKRARRDLGIVARKEKKLGGDWYLEMPPEPRNREFDQWGVAIGVCGIVGTLYTLPNKSMAYMASFEECQECHAR